MHAEISVRSHACVILHKFVHVTHMYEYLYIRVFMSVRIFFAFCLLQGKDHNHFMLPELHCVIVMQSFFSVRYMLIIAYVELQ